MRWEGGGLSGSSLTSRLEDGGPTPVLTLKRSGAFFEPANRIRSSNWESMFWKQENESLSGSIVTRVSLRVQRRLLRTILSNWQGCGEFRTNRPPPSCSFALPHLRCNPTYRLILLLMVAFGRVFLLSGRAWICSEWWRLCSIWLGRLALRNNSNDMLLPFPCVDWRLPSKTLNSVAGSVSVSLIYICRVS